MFYINWYNYSITASAKQQLVMHWVANSFTIYWKIQLRRW